MNCPINMINPAKKTCIACGNRCNSEKIAKFIPIIDENAQKTAIITKIPPKNHISQWTRPKTKNGSRKVSKKGKSPYTVHFGATTKADAFPREKRKVGRPVKEKTEITERQYKETSIKAVKAQIVYAIDLLKQKKSELVLKRLQTLVGVI